MNDEVIVNRRMLQGFRKKVRFICNEKQGIAFLNQRLGYKDKFKSSNPFNLSRCLVSKKELLNICKHVAFGIYANLTALFLRIKCLSANHFVWYDKIIPFVQRAPVYLEMFFKRDQIFSYTRSISMSPALDQVHLYFTVKVLLILV